MYFSSTLKGGNFIYVDTRTGQINQHVSAQVRGVLEACSTVQMPAHRTGANCGEPLACQTFCCDQPTMTFPCSQAFAVTWGRYSYDSLDAGVLKPCGEVQHHGLSQDEEAEEEPSTCDKFLGGIPVRSFRIVRSLDIDEPEKLPIRHALTNVRPQAHHLCLNNQQSSPLKGP